MSPHRSLGAPAPNSWYVPSRRFARGPVQGCFTDTRPVSVLDLQQMTQFPACPAVFQQRPYLAVPKIQSLIHKHPTSPHRAAQLCKLPPRSQRCRGGGVSLTNRQEREVEIGYITGPLRARINPPIMQSFSRSISVTVSNPTESGFLCGRHKVLLCLRPELTPQKADTLISRLFQTPRCSCLADPRSRCRRRVLFTLPLLFAGGSHHRLQRLMPPPLREQLASGAAIRELQGAGARGTSCQQPEQRPRAATFPARNERRSAQAGSPTLEGFALRHRIPPPWISDSRRLLAGCILHLPWV